MMSTDWRDLFDPCHPDFMFAKGVYQKGDRLFYRSDFGEVGLPDEFPEDEDKGRACLKRIDVRLEEHYRAGDDIREVPAEWVAS